MGPRGGGWHQAVLGMGAAPPPGAVARPRGCAGTRRGQRVSPQGQGLSRAGGAAGRAGLSTDTLIAATARQGPAGGVARWGQRGGFALQIKAPTHPPWLLPALPTWELGGVGFGAPAPPARAPWGSAHPSSAATASIYSGPGPPPATDTARRSLTLKRGGLIGRQPRGRGSCPPGLSPAVAAGSGVVARGREQTRASPRGAVGGTMRLCAAGTIGDGKPRQENKGAAGWRDAVPAGTATAGDGPATATGAAGAGRCCRGAAARPGGTPVSGRCWGHGGPSGICAFSALWGWLVAVPTAVAAAGGDRLGMALAVSLLRAAFPMTPRPARQQGG